MEVFYSRVLFLSNYAAPYEGNFIASLVALESLLVKKYNSSVAYVFPESVKLQPWFRIFCISHQTYTTRLDVSNSFAELMQIKEVYKPTLIHTHFDGYDMIAKKVFEKEAVIVWHMHNHLSYVSNPLKAFYQVFCFWKHYGVMSRNINIIAVSDDMLRFASRWKRRALCFSGLLKKVPNGIDLTRVANKRHQKTFDGIFRFLSFGGRNSDKRIDVLLRAAQNLWRLRQDFQIVVTKGVDTQTIVQDCLGKQVPEWLQLVDQTHDIASLFNMVDCFISSSCHETFSYAICEASIFGLPVIQSDIEGTMWNAHNPSTRIFKLNDIHDLCQQMSLLIDTNRDELSKQVNRTIINNTREYSLEQWACNIVEFYKCI